MDRLTRKPAALKAGAATSNITPRLGISLNGGMQDRKAEQVHDELHARCLVLDDGGVRLALVVCDSCMIPGDVLKAAKHLAHESTGIAPDRILISATHTHSAPSAAGVFQSDADAEYQEFLALRIADGIRRAVGNLRPAQLGWGIGTLDSVVFNRRWKMSPETRLSSPFGTPDGVKMNPPVGSPDLVEPSGPIDPVVTVLSVRTAEGRPLALWANYSLHYVGGVPGNDVSADYYGAFCDRMQELLGADRLDPPFVGLLTNGTSGDINNNNFRTPWAKQPPYGQLRFVADRLAGTVVEVLKGIEYATLVPLDMVEKSVVLGVRRPGPGDLEAARAILSRGNGLPLKGMEEIYARETVLLDRYPPRVTAPLQALRIGGLGIAAIPCETFVEIGLGIRERSPFKPTCTVSLANDYLGYLPTAAQHALGGYETWRARSSFLEVEAAAKIEARIAELFGILAARG